MKRAMILTAGLFLAPAFCFSENGSEALQNAFENLSSPAAAPEQVLSPVTALQILARQNYESQKRQEMAALLSKLVGGDKAGVVVHFDWPTALPEGVNDQPSKISATVVLDRSIQEAEAAFARDLAVKVLALDPQRGDQLEIYQLSRNSSLAEILAEPRNVLDIFKFFVLITMAFVIVATFSKMSKQINASLERISTDAKSAVEMMEVRLAAQKPALSASSTARLAEPVPSGSSFSHVDPEALSRALEGENSKAIALFITTLDPEIAGRVLANLSPSKQEEVALTISQMEGEPDAREVAQFQAQIHLKLRKLLLEKK